MGPGGGVTQPAGPYKDTTSRLSGLDEVEDFVRHFNKTVQTLATEAFAKHSYVPLEEFWQQAMEEMRRWAEVCVQRWIPWRRQPKDPFGPPPGEPTWVPQDSRGNAAFLLPHPPRVTKATPLSLLGGCCGVKPRPIPLGAILAQPTEGKDREVERKDRPRRERKDTGW